MKLISRTVIGVACISAIAGMTVIGGAAADPSGTPTYRALVAEGSDTTMDVMNGFAGALTASGSDYRYTGLLHSAVAVNDGSIKTSLKPAVGDILTIENESQTGTVQNTTTPTTTAFTVNFIPRVGDSVTVNSETRTISAVSVTTSVNALITLGSALTNAPVATDAVTGHTQETVKVLTVTDASAYAAPSTAAVNYNLIALDTAYSNGNGGLIKYAHSKNAGVLGAFVANGDKVLASYNSVGTSFQSRANANCQFIANNAGSGTQFSGTTQNGTTYTADGGSVSGTTNVASSTYVNGGRANGSGSGAKAVGSSLLNTNAAWGCVDVARASSTQTGITDVTTAGTKMVNIPFALDGIGFAVTTTSNFLRKYSPEALKAIYACDAAYGMIDAAQDITKAPALPSPNPNAYSWTPGSASGVTTVQAYAKKYDLRYAALPQAGSGTREFVIVALGISATKTDSLATIGKKCLTDTTPTGGVLEEHDLRTLDDYGIGLTSIAQSITQREQAVSGVSDKQGRTVLVALDTTGSTSGTTVRSSGDRKIWYPTTMTSKVGGASGTTNGAVVLWRNVYNTVPAFRLGDPNIQKMFVGTTSDICVDAAGTLANYGFSPMPTGECGIAGAVG